MTSFVKAPQHKMYIWSWSVTYVIMEISNVEIYFCISVLEISKTTMFYHLIQLIGHWCAVFERLCGFGTANGVWKNMRAHDKAPFIDFWFSTTYYYRGVIY